MTHDKNKSGSTTKRAGVPAGNPVLFFVLKFAGLLVLFYFILHSSFFREYFFDKLIGVNAFLASKFLNLFGQATSFSGGTISSGVHSVSIKQGCDALEPMAMFAAGIISFPASTRTKLKGLLYGILFLFSVNVLRIVSLFIVNRYRPSWFELMHVEIWQALFIILAISCWIFWIVRSRTPVAI